MTEPLIWFLGQLSRSGRMDIKQPTAGGEQGKGREGRKGEKRIEKGESRGRGKWRAKQSGM